MEGQLKPFIWEKSADYMGFEPKVRCEDGEIAPDDSDGFYHYQLGYEVHPEYDVDSGAITHWETMGIYPIGRSENQFKSKEDAMAACWQNHCRKVLFYFK